MAADLEEKNNNKSSNIITNQKKNTDKINDDMQLIWARNMIVLV